MSTCRACRAEVLWAETPAGKKQPFDRRPDPEGNRVLLHRGRGTPPLAIPVSWLGLEDRKLSDEERLELDAARYMPHHASCPARAQFRQKRRRSPAGV